MRAIAPFLLLVLAAGSASAQDADGCGKFKWSIARERSAFSTPGLQEIEQGKPLPGVMDPAIVKLKPVADVAFERPPAHKPKPDTFGAVLKTPPLAVGGAYQITISDEAWIDVIQGGRDLRSTAFSGQSGCPNVRKSVRFTLSSGEATIQISGSAADSIKVDLVPVM